METKHTQSAWILDGSTIRNAAADPKTGNIEVIAECYAGFNYSETKDECKANAVLISAAPDLLAAAKDALAYLSKVNCGDKGDQARQQLESAIKKAEGE